MRGRKPLPTALRIVGGNAGHRPLPKHEVVATGRPKPPVPLQPREAVLWASMIEPAFWLAEADSAACWGFVVLQAEFEADPTAFNAARIGQWRTLAAEIGLTPSSRARLGGNRPAPNPSSVFFD